MSQPVSKFNDSTLYVDTMIFHIFLRDPESSARQLLRRVQQGKVQAYTSVLTFDELTFRLLLALIRDKYSGSPLDRLRNDEESMIAEFYPKLAPRIERLRQFPNLNLIDITTDDLASMNENILRYHLRPRDALHLSAMQKARCFNLLSEDSDYTRVSGIRHFTLT